MVRRSGLWSPSKSARFTYSHFLARSTNRQGTGGISSVTTVGGFGGSTTGCTVKVAAKPKGTEPNELLRDTVGIVETLRDGLCVDFSNA